MTQPRLLRGGMPRSYLLVTLACAALFLWMTYHAMTKALEPSPWQAEVDAWHDAVDRACGPLDLSRARRDDEHLKGQFRCLRATLERGMAR